VEALSFLRQLGLAEPDLVAEVIEKVLPKYTRATAPQHDGKAHLKDVSRIVKALATDSDKRRAELVEALNETPFLWSVNQGAREEAYKKPGDVYVASPDLHVYFRGNPEAWFLSDIYDSVLGRLAPLEIDEEVSVDRRTADNYGHVDLHSTWGDHARGLKRFDPGRAIHGLEYALSNPTLERSAFIWNVLLSANAFHVSGEVERSTRQDYSNARREREFSPMGRLAREKVWLPGPDGCLHRPAELGLDDLPDPFDRDQEELARELGMNVPAVAEAAALAGVKPKHLEFIRQHPDAVDRMIAEFGAHTDEDHASKPEPKDDLGAGPTQDDDLGLDFAEEFDNVFASRAGKPSDADEDHELDSELPDPEGRRMRVKQQIAAARTNSGGAPPFERVARNVWDAKDSQVRGFLQEQYHGHCQICDGMFLKRDGTPYFEGLYIVSRIKASWLDRYGNVMSLCPTCCAKLLYGSVEATDLKDQVLAATPSRDGRRAVLSLKLCGEPATVSFSARHLIDLQEMLRAAI